MRITLGTPLLLVAACITFASARPDTAFAQTTQPPDLLGKKITLKIESADLRRALTMLFDSAGANFSLDQAVQGTVTLSVTDVPFRTALESLLRSTESQVPLSYRVADGVYIIAPRAKSEVPPVSTELPEAPAKPKNRAMRIPLNWVDAESLAKLLGGTAVSLAIQQGRTSGGGFGSGFGSGAFGTGGQNGNGAGFGSGSSGLGNFGSGFAGNSGGSGSGRGPGGGAPGGR